MTIFAPGFSMADLDAPLPEDPAGLLQRLVQDGYVTAAQAQAAQEIAARENLTVLGVLQTRFSLSQRSLALVQNATLSARMIDPMIDAPDRALVQTFGAAQAMAGGVLPWRRMGDCTLILSPDYARFLRQQPALTAALGPVRMGVSMPDQITGALARDFGADLVRRAETRLPAADSCRDWRAGRAMGWVVVAAFALVAATVAAPVAVITAFSALAVVLLVLTGGIKVAAALSGLRTDAAPSVASPDGPLPIITLLVPLYRERAIADHLLTRLEALDYPRERLDVCLVLEDNDTTTKEALGRTRLLTWMRSITVPEGTLRTKPRALNYALDFARGSIVGVYDAEDAPATDQLRIVAATFAGADPQVACLQGVLDYYNSSANWLTRCFTLEYASWFRVVLPGYARMGLVVPLGGTTLFFRRDILERLGGWDAHNVTEDADLGLRLARAGYRTAFIPSVTEEEANGRFWPWVKQRSRWLKGYGVTWCVHMREPRALWRDLGPWRFFGVQVLFAGTLSQFLLAPLVWSFWLVPFGVHHPAADLLPRPVFWAMVGLFITCELANFAIAALAVRRAGKGWLIPWALTLQLYFPLGAVACYKGLLELTWKPFYWHKTAHGILLPKHAPATAPPRPLPHPVSDA
ncbi:glycosyltransferase family 2 protein [Loktanella sp. M215]|uniref:glycosyltransferase family 2 protein n=1 Tax=Loktanella sp. M215 TaxID=2675431 RepID=UPI001F2C5669|nr:glycosyltransferase family 2 protein [Loktanella sp. M215]